MVRPPTIKEVFSEKRGPSKVRRLVSKPMLADPLNSFLLPSRLLMSSTEEIRPPYLAGMLLFYSSMSFTTSGLKTEKKPNRWVGL